MNSALTCKEMENHRCKDIEDKSQEMHRKTDLEAGNRCLGLFIQNELRWTSEQEERYGMKRKVEQSQREWAEANIKLAYLQIIATTSLRIS